MDSEHNNCSQEVSQITLTTGTDFSRNTNIRQFIKFTRWWQKNLSVCKSQFNGRRKSYWLGITEHPPPHSGCFWHFPEGGALWLWITWSINNSLVWCINKVSIEWNSWHFYDSVRVYKYDGNIWYNAWWGSDMWSPLPVIDTDITLVVINLVTVLNCSTLCTESRGYF